jgi:hypothetical protein
VFNWYNEENLHLILGIICGTRSKTNLKKLEKYDLILRGAGRDLSILESTNFFYLDESQYIKNKIENF